MTSQPSSPLGRQRLSLNRGWRFHHGDVAHSLVQGHSDTYANAKAGVAWGAAGPDFDDTSWRELDLPHDWVVEGPFVQTENISQGFRPRGVSWYRRHFVLPASDRGRHLELQFDAIGAHCTVWVNGVLAHRNFCGYTSFTIDITPFAKFGDQLNTIAIRADATVMEGWWYEGAGIYRHTWLVKRDAAHIVTDGIHANPTRNADGTWTVPITATLYNAAVTRDTVTVESTLLDPAGKPVAAVRTSAALAPLSHATAQLSLNVGAPKLWSIESPTLYHVRTVVLRDNIAVDSATTPCGFRTIRFDANLGFFLNEKPVKIKGVCCHQDHAGVGVAVPDSILEFRLRTLQRMGVNAYRCAHNPPAAELLDLCDRLGILVMDENRHFNCTPEYERQLQWLVRRDRNHPSVIIWSVFNEEPLQGTEIGTQMVRRMVATVRDLDPTRPVTAAMNFGQFDPINVTQAVDVAGLNYQPENYDRFHQKNPTLPIVSSEDTSAFMTRGEYISDKPRNVLASDDTEYAIWGTSHRNSWRQIATRPYMAGCFIWTGFDYRGEPTPLPWPSAATFFGAIDLCGFPKTAFYIHQSNWIKDRPILQLAPHWNWTAGQPVMVFTPTNADAVEIFLNGQSLGQKPVEPFDFPTWSVPFAPGKLEAVATKAGKEIARATVETTGQPAALELLPDRTSLAADGRDALPITVRALDADGRPVPTANLPVEFSLQGPADIIGLGNGDPNCHEPEKGIRRSLFNGLAQIILQSRTASGAITLRAAAPGLTPATLTLTATPAALLPEVPVQRPSLTLRQWRMSLQTATRPDPNQLIADSDMNSWITITPGVLQAFPTAAFALYRTKFTPFSHAQTHGGALRFESIAGTAEIYLDSKLVAQKTDPAPAPLTLALPPAAGERTLTLLVYSATPAGLAAAVKVEESQSQ